MAAAPKMAEAYGALEDMGMGDSAKPAKADEGGSDDMAGLSEEEKMAAEDLGFDAAKAMALRRFVKACIEADAGGDYDQQPESEPPPAEPTGEM